MTAMSSILRWLTLLVLPLFFSVFPILAQTVSNVRIYRVSDDSMVVYYDLASSGPSAVRIEASTDGGANYLIQPKSLSGDVGPAVASGKNRRIVWDAAKDGVVLRESTVVRVFVGGETEQGPSPARTIDSGSSEERITALSAESPIHLDGALSEPAWKSAVPVSGFTQRELVEGASPTERTEVRILYDRENLYIGVTCYDSEPSRIMRRELKWDGDLDDDDMFAFVLDTYHDRRAGFWFAVNPNGARADATFQSDKENEMNSQWDGIWEAVARVTDTGWTCEIAIPFKTLRFPATGAQEWGVNFERLIRRKNEEILWRGWRRDEGLFHLPSAGTFVIPERVKSGRQFDAIPYVLSGAEKIRGEKVDEVFKYGIDLRYGITSNSILDLTAKTDFAQIESDRDVINLTRFNITYPEKRDFFLEGMENFEFTQYTTQLFYSRKIGIDPVTREAIPILGGAKLTQKTGGYRVGVLSVQTERKGNVPETNYSILRVKRDILRQSTIGFMGANVIDRTGRDSQLYATDFSLRTDRFLGRRNFLVDGYAAQSVRDGDPRGGFSGRFNIAYPNDLIESFLLYDVIQKKFDPDISYVQRQGIQTYIIHVNWFPRPPIPFVKKLSIQPLDFNDTVGLDGRQLTRIYESRPIGIVFNSDNELSLTIDDFLEYVDSDFPIFGSTVIPRGTYTYRYYTIRYATNPNRAVAASVSNRWGGFYSGDRAEWTGDVTLKTNRYLALTADMNQNDITIGSSRAITREYGGRVEFDASTRLSSSLFVQYNNRTRDVTANFRIHFIPRTGSDLYLVYNQLLDEREDYRTLRATGMFKLDWTYRM
jgi:hypothetical protein